MKNEIQNGALMWNIRKIVSKGDYYYAVVPEHPMKTKNNYVLLHRIVMENHLGHLLDSNLIVHHLNGNKKENSIANLQVMSASEHLHYMLKKEERLCVSLNVLTVNVTLIYQRIKHIYLRVTESPVAPRLVEVSFGEMYN